MLYNIYNLINNYIGVFQWVTSIIVGVELTESEDSAFMIEAYKAGMSKRKFAREIIVNWLRKTISRALRKSIMTSCKALSIMPLENAETIF